jgi:hypothetical protein
MGAASNSDRRDDPLQSRSDAKDGCLICHFVAQGQLATEFCPGSSPQVIADLVIAELPASRTYSDRLASCPRAPPIVFRGLS